MPSAWGRGHRGTPPVAVVVPAPDDGHMLRGMSSLLWLASLVAQTPPPSTTTKLKVFLTDGFWKPSPKSGSLLSMMSAA